MTDFRVERDSMGEVRLPAQAYYGAHTQRAVENFTISGEPLPSELIRAVGLVKWAAAGANEDLGLLAPEIADAIRRAADAVVTGEHDGHFPIDVFQTGSGTSTNMNANEVIARLATQLLGSGVHPNDHVNMGQSSNDVIPTAIHVSAALEVQRQLLPALEHLASVIESRSAELADTRVAKREHSQVKPRRSSDLDGTETHGASSRDT